jgi:hypothetical protein
MNLKLLIPIVSLTEATLGSVLIHDVNISPFRFSKSLELDQNSQVNFTLSGSVVCTHDYHRRIPFPLFHSNTALSLIPSGLLRQENTVGVCKNIRFGGLSKGIGMNILTPITDLGKTGFDFEGTPDQSNTIWGFQVLEDGSSWRSG